MTVLTSFRFSNYIGLLRVRFYHGDTSVETVFSHLKEKVCHGPRTKLTSVNGTLDKNCLGNKKNKRNFIKYNLLRMYISEETVDLLYV